MGNKLKFYTDCLSIKDTSDKNEFYKFCVTDHGSVIKNSIYHDKNK